MFYVSGNQSNESVKMDNKAPIQMKNSLKITLFSLLRRHNSSS